MPDLTFRVTGVEPGTRGLAPLVVFDLEVENTPAGEQIQSAALQAQIQFQCPRRAYSPREKEKLVELFGTPDRWGQTLRNRLWTLSSTTLGSFSGKGKGRLIAPCSYDLNIGAAKYFYGLDDGEIPLLFLFSGTIFYTAPDGRLQVQRISHEKECVWRMPVQTWRDLMDHHWPRTAWITLERDLFDRLCEFKRDNGHTNWDQALEDLLDRAQVPEPTLS